MLYSPASSSYANKEVTTNDKCAVCNENFIPKNLVISTECKHNFHMKCLSDRVVEKGNNCPTCNVDMTSGKMLQTKKIYNDISEAFNARDFLYIKEYMERSPYRTCYLKLFNNIIQEDIQNQKTANIKTTLDLLGATFKSSNDVKDAANMLIKILGNLEIGHYKDTIADMFFDFRDYGIREYCLTFYIEQRSFDKIQQTMRKLKEQAYFKSELLVKTLSEDINNNNIANIAKMLDLLTNTFTYQERYSWRLETFFRKRITELEVILDDLAKKGNLDIVPIFLKYNITTKLTLTIVWNHYIQQRNFDELTEILTNIHSGISLDDFYNALIEDIDKKNLDNIQKFLRLASCLIQQHKSNDIKNSLEILLDNLAINANNREVIDVFINNGIKTNFALNCALEHAIDAEDFSRATDLISRYKLILTPSFFEQSLEKNIELQKLGNINNLLQLRSFYEQNQPAVFYNINTAICNFLEKINLNNIDVINTFLANNITSRKIIVFALKYYIREKNANLVNAILQKIETKDREDIVRLTFKQLCQQENIQENQQEDILYFMKLMQQNKTYDAADLQKLTSIFTEVIQEVLNQK